MNKNNIESPNDDIKTVLHTIRIAACYIRVSTDDQMELSPESQLDEARKYGKSNNIIIPDEYVFIENRGRSGKKAHNRPEFQRMIGFAKSEDHPFDIILVWKFSRFARNQEESILYKSLLKKINVDVISISEPLIEGPFGELIERIIEWMDEYYSIRLAGDVLRGMTKKATLGGYQTMAPFGYDLKDGVLYQNEYADIVKNIYHMYQHEGKQLVTIARYLNSLGIKSIRGNMFENRSVKYILQNPVYKGYIRWNPNGKEDMRVQKNHTDDLIIVRGKHDPIVSEDDWAEVNDKILREAALRKYSKPVIEKSHWLTGILKCNSCGSNLASGGSGGFQCYAYVKGRCNVSHFVKHEKIEKAVINALTELYWSGNFDYDILTIDNNDEKLIIQDNLKKLDARMKRIKDAYVNGIDTIDEYKSNKEKITSDRNNLLNRLSSLDAAQKTDDTKGAMMDRLRSVLSVITSDADNLSKNTAIKSIVNKIVYSKKPENIDITLYYS